MKKTSKTLLSLSLLAMIGASASIATVDSFKKPVSALAAATKPTTIDLNDTDEEDIRDYYSYLNTLPESERRGENLLKNLKKIMVENPNNPSKPAQYFSYANARQIYDITDRNWVKDPAEGIDGYDASTNTITGFKYDQNPYLYYYYRNDNYTNPLRAKDKVEPVGGGTAQQVLNQEHVWSQSHGFKPKDDSATAVPNAGTDLHHLVAGDQAVNKWGHSNDSYGYVKDEESSWATSREKWGQNGALEGNKRGTPLNAHSEDQSTVVFEPRDEDKGDLARALLYMVARYNYIGGDKTTSTIDEPNLELVDYVISGEETVTCGVDGDTAKYGMLSDILDWHKLDPVDDSTDEGYHEVHRNNLIYTNFQNTRNPFIDFPDWVDLIWGDKKETGKADPVNDQVYGSKIAPTQLTIKDTVTKVTKGKTLKLSISAVAPVEASKSVKWESSNPEIATVSKSGVVTGVKTGSVVITATSKLDANVKATITITVESAGIVDEITSFIQNNIWVVFVVVGVILLICIILILTTKGKTKTKAKKVAKNIVKSVTGSSSSSSSKSSSSKKSTSSKKSSSTKKK